MSDYDWSDQEFANDLDAELFEYRMSRRRLLQAGGALLGAAAAGPLIFTTADPTPTWAANLPYNAHTSVKGTVEFWHHYGSTVRRDAVRRAMALFHHYYPHITVKDTAFPFGANWDKVVADEAAGGKGVPDLIVSDRPKLWHEAKHHIYENLADLAKRDRLNPKNFWPSLWAQCKYKGGIYGLPWEADTKVLFWNRGKFYDAKLNPNKPPTTWSALKSLADKLDAKGGSNPGGWSTITFVPKWGTFGMADLAYLNNSRWETSKQKPTINSSANIAAGDFYKFWIDRYGNSTLSAIDASNTDSGHEEFGRKVVALEMNLPTQQAIWQYYDIRFYRSAPTPEQQRIFPYWGAGLAPVNGKSKPRTTNGGFGLSIPINHHRSKANRDATWEFAKFMAMVGMRLFAQAVLAIPGDEHMSKTDPILTGTTHWKVFMQAMSYGAPFDVNYKDNSFPGDVLGDAQNAVDGGSSAKDALDKAQSAAITKLSQPGGG